MFRIFFIALISLHGLIHLMGFVKAFDYAKIDALTSNISKPVGLIWLSAAILFFIAVYLFFTESDYLWLIGGIGIVLSQILILLSWKDAKYGTIANLLILIPVIISFAGSLQTSYKNRYKSEVEKELHRIHQQSLLTENDIAHLPLPVQKYLIYTGSINKDKVQNFRAVFEGGIKPNPDSDFLDFKSVQYNFYNKPSRIFYIESSMFGLPFNGLHLFTGSNATMQIKVANLFQVADAKGPKMNQGETVTLFNDMCIIAPATLIDKNIVWEEVDSLTVKAKFTNQGITISATLFFNDIGELINFSSDDRFESADGINYYNYTWLTPISAYQEFNGRKLAAKAELIWKKPGGNSIYGKFTLKEIEYNAVDFK